MSDREPDLRCASQIRPTAAVAMLLLLPLLAVALAAPPAIERPVKDREWLQFKIDHNKSYASDVEENFRRSVFHDNQRKINEHNEKYDLGLFTYKIEMNQFGDMLYDEYNNYMHADNQTIMITNITRVPRGREFVRPNGTEVPATFDWRKKGAVTPVQDQGLTCGSCWAFSATGALEGQYFMKTGVLTELSAQCLIDCTQEYGNMGCGGGSAAISFQYVLDRRGLEKAAGYAYEGRTKSCPFDRPDDGKDQLTDASSFVYIGGLDEELLKVAVATAGPISTAIDGSHDTFRFYSEGVYYQPECNEDDLDHAVLIVGYGSDPKHGDYWLVKNSWGERWGEAGYFRIARNRDNHCGIAAAGMYPDV